MTYALEIQGVTKQYDEGGVSFLALRGIDMTANKGEILFLTGPSGSGKTTLVSIIGGVLRASSGVVKVFGEDIVKLGESKLPRFRLETIGFIFQGANLIPSLSVMENVRLPLLLQGVPIKDAEERSAHSLERVGLRDMLKRKPKQLSGGQRQRVAIARAVVGRPPLILADEPTASLDAKSGQEVMTLLSEMCREQGHTVCVVTHDSRIFQYADRILAIEDGSLKEGVVAHEHR